MEIYNIPKKLKYLSNPSAFYSVLFSSQSGYYSLPHKAISSILNHNTNGESHLLCKNPNLNPLINFVCSIRSASVSSAKTTLFCGNNYSVVAHPFCISNIPSLLPHRLFQSFSAFSSDACPSTSSEKLGGGVSHGSQSSRTRRRKITHGKQNVDSQRIVEIVELIQREEESDLVSKLNRMNVNLPPASISEIIRVLNCKRVSALCFFYLIRDTHPGFYSNSEACSLIINNVGQLEDFESMLLLLQDFKLKKVSLTEKAFGFVSDCSSNGASVKETITRVIEVLEKAGGSCRISGIYSLIKLLCVAKTFDLAIFVMEETERKTSYYNVLIQAKCQDGDFQEPQDLIDGMKRFGCDPNANTYNYLLGSLCKNGRTVEACKLLDEMRESGLPLDAITFEIFICYSCRLWRLDFAREFLHKMTSRGLEPRLTTHAAFIKGYFYSGQYQEAYKYVVDIDVNYKCSINTCYSLLARLHQRQGRIVVAQDEKEGSVVDARDVLIQMLEKGLKPDFPVYINVLKDLYKSGKQNLAADLKSRFSKFLSSSGAG